MLIGIETSGSQADPGMPLLIHDVGDHVKAEMLRSCYALRPAHWNAKHIRDAHRDIRLHNAAHRRHYRPMTGSPCKPLDIALMLCYSSDGQCRAAPMERGIVATGYEMTTSSIKHFRMNAWFDVVGSLPIGDVCPNSEGSGY